MPLADTVEHFVTLFDSNFLPMGMALHESLLTHAQPFHLWIVCMDELVEEQLGRLALPHVTLLPLHTVEDERLLAVKPGRSRGEYCWTMTPFTFQAVFDRDATVKRVTYLDADLFFFADPRMLLQELDSSGKQILITEHAYATEYKNKQLLSGRFCVQFLTVNNTIEAAKVVCWWQDKCLEWCFNRHENGKFGDQKYLDFWPELFREEVHIVEKVDKTLAPWNVRHFEKVYGKLSPVFYHFHDLRIVRHDKVRLYFGYRIDKSGLSLYENYIKYLTKSLLIMKNLGISVPIIKNKVPLTFKIYNFLLRKNHYQNIRGLV